MRANAPGKDSRRLGILDWVFHFVVLPLLFVLAVIAIIGLASVYLSPGGYFDGNAIDDLRSSIPVAAGVLLLFAILAVFSFAGLYGWRKWSLVTIIVLLVMLAVGGIAASLTAGSYLAAHGTLLALVDARLSAALGWVRVGGIVAAIIAVLFIVYYARHSRSFVSAAELREQEKLVTYEQW